MNPSKVDIHELIGWELDEYPYRSSALDLSREELAKQIEQAKQAIYKRDCYANCSALLEEETESINDLLATGALRTDLRDEYEGLDWMLGVVDLRRLLAFQRRLVFGSYKECSPIPQQDEWPQLISLALSSPRDTTHQLLSSGGGADGLDVSLSSSNPDFQLRLSPGKQRSELFPFSLYGGSPFFEVAEHLGRWFLRDGYHRAYRLLQAGVYFTPAVVLHARTMEEVGATESWFFGKEQLFSDRPPQVMDFLDESLVVRYERAALRKVIRIRVEESLEPFDETDEVQGEKL
jgi:hypothetical protein